MNTAIEAIAIDINNIREKRKQVGLLGIPGAFNLHDILFVNTCPWLCILSLHNSKDSIWILLFLGNQGCCFQAK